ncbi:MAG: hypothetical protein GF333_04470 [Candidatus Omnitrophica bacterium]|nr:hypothetical protein [Candidatus Omnitrophota bacterium]
MPNKKSVADLSALSEQQLLDLRLCELPLQIQGTWLEACVRQLYAELDRREIPFKPPCYLADEWLTPDKEPVVGIPFYLAHPALMKLERKMMLDVEGGTRPWCMKLLRHETGHALNYAYRFYRRRKWQKIFGRFSADYGDTYRYRPYSKAYVRHLEDYYAQYHPDEDFAETFAVWIASDSQWRRKYQGWKALEKLKYVEELMREIQGREPPLSRGKRYWDIRAMRITLKNHYKKKRRDHAENFPDFHDTNLKRIFTTQKNELTAVELLKKNRRMLVQSVSTWTGEKKYMVNKLMETIQSRCRYLRLYVPEDEPVSLAKVSVYLTTLAMNYLHTGRFGRER